MAVLLGAKGIVFMAISGLYFLMREVLSQSQRIEPKTVEI